MQNPEQQFMSGRKCLKFEQRKIVLQEHPMDSAAPDIKVKSADYYFEIVRNQLPILS